MRALAPAFLLSGAAAFAPARSHLPLQQHARSLDRPLSRQAPTASTRVAASARTSQRGLVVRHAAAAAKAEAAPLDKAALVKYAVAIATQVGLIGSGLYAVDTLAAALPKLPSVLTTALTALLFLGLSLKSRAFNPLRNARPNRAKAVKGEATDGFYDRTMPSWTPPGITFPIMWVLIVAPLRAFATVSAASACGGHLLNWATLSLVLHLSVGDTWNTVNNVERRTGAAVPGVLLVWASCLNAVLAHARLPVVSPLGAGAAATAAAAGIPAAACALGATLVWITVAAALVAATWRVNGREPLYPVKRPADQPQTQFAWFQKTPAGTAPATATPKQVPPLPAPALIAETVGAAGTAAFRLFFRRDGARASPWHQVPLSAGPGLYNFVAEIPKMTTAKMEVSTTEAFNPIAQDLKKGQLRNYHGPIFWNYGCLPQTWENPDVRHPELQVGGDGDPLDVVELGSVALASGSVVPVKVLGVLAMVDDGELDWKVVAIAASDPLAAELHDVADVEAKLPGTISGIREWFRWYKTPDGKPLNAFGFDEQCLPAAAAKEVIAETHAAWKGLRAGTTAAGKLWVN